MQRGYLEEITAIQEEAETWRVDGQLTIAALALLHICKYVKKWIRAGEVAKLRMWAGGNRIDRCDTKEERRLVEIALEVGRADNER